MKVLILGVSGMIGNAMFRILSENAGWEVFGTARSVSLSGFFPPALDTRLITGIDVVSSDVLMRIFGEVKPAVVINCIGLTKHHPEGNDPLPAISINSMLPHRLSDTCRAIGARFIHVSTDCVFSGTKGSYVEDDIADATDVYGKTKFLGEVSASHAITLRTSTIGHELRSTFGLLEWFLNQGDRCTGFSRAIFSGLPTVSFAKVIRDVVIPRPELFGVFHVGAEAINKYDLLTLIAEVYKKPIEIVRDDDFIIDRSMNVKRFCDATGYVAPNWFDLISIMHHYDQIKN